MKQHWELFQCNELRQIKMYKSQKLEDVVLCRARFLLYVKKNILEKV